MLSAGDHRNCPLRLLSKNCACIPPTQAGLLDLDERVAEYLAAPEAARPALRQTLFFKLSPCLIKLLGRYCSRSKGCGVNCQVSELLSAAYLAFTDLIETFDFSRHLNFLGYVVSGLSWGLFNTYLKEVRRREHEILMDVNDENPTAAQGEKKSLEETWLSAVEAERLLAVLKPGVREMFVLHCMFGFSCVDLARMEHAKVKTVQKTIERARKKIIGAYNHRTPRGGAHPAHDGSA